MRKFNVALVLSLLLAFAVSGQTIVGAFLRVNATGETAFPTVTDGGNIYRGGLAFGTDAGILYLNRGGNPWVPVWAAPQGDSSASPGNATLNNLSGRSAFAGAASSVTITNSWVTASSVIHATLQTQDASLLYVRSVVPSAGSFVINGNTTATGTTVVAWSVVP